MKTRRSALGEGSFRQRLSILGLIILTGVTGAFYTHHFVATADGLRIYRKASFGFQESLVDMSSLSFLELRSYPRTTRAMISAGDASLLPGGTALEVLKDLGHNLQDVLDGFNFDAELQDYLEGFR